MIIRIAGEGQFRLKSSHLDRLNQLDNNVVARVAESKEKEYTKAYARLIEFVKSKGEELGAEELLTSDVVLPSSDLSLAEAKKMFVGEGIVPG